LRKVLVIVLGVKRLCHILVALVAAQGLGSTRGFSEIQGEPCESRLPQRPNIVFLYTDDQAQWAMGAYGNRDIKTPHLDRLARRGAIFRNAFTVTPVCSPSRAALMTSRYSSELGIADWINPQKEPDLGLAPAAITWPELLKGFGYATMLARNWCAGPGWSHPGRRSVESSPTSTCSRRSWRWPGWECRKTWKSVGAVSFRCCEAEKPRPGTTRFSGNTTCIIIKSLK
jgi:hypothetical protein